MYGDFLNYTTNVSEKNLLITCKSNKNWKLNKITSEDVSENKRGQLNFSWPLLFIYKLQYYLTNFNV